jgi:hypothetical protein
MEKLSINKLIANDIVNYGMDRTMSFNYIVSLDSFLDDYDEDTCNYIKAHLSEIIDDVHQNENVAQLDYDEKRQEFDMVFYYDNLLSPIEKQMIDIGKEKGVEFEYEDLKSMSYDFEESDEYKELLNNFIDNKLDLGKEM